MSDAPPPSVVAPATSAGASVRRRTTRVVVVVVVGLALRGAAAFGRTAGATASEARGPLPGDELAPAARSVATRAIDLRVPPAAVLPWLKQVGHRRAGWYAVDPIERLFGGGTFVDGTSSRRIVPELQTLAVGDRIPLDDRRDLVVVTLAEPPLDPAALVLRLDATALTWVWSFVVRATPTGSRLVVRTRVDAAHPVARATLPALDLGHAAVEGLMLWRLRRRAEGRVRPVDPARVRRRRRLRRR